MTDEELLKVYEIYERMKKMFGDNLPDPEHYPKQFSYYVMLYKHSKKHGY